jgi:hypothetical protein
MISVYMLNHINNVNEDKKLIGFYESKEEAEKAIHRAVKLPGFCDCPDGFIIQEIEIDKDLIPCED